MDIMNKTIYVLPKVRFDELMKTNKVNSENIINKEIIVKLFLEVNFITEKNLT